MTIIRYRISPQFIADIKAAVKARLTSASGGYTVELIGKTDATVMVENGVGDTVVSRSRTAARQAIRRCNPDVEFWLAPRI